MGYTLPDEAVRNGFARVCELTGLMGRWQKIGEHPAIICDTGHNVGGIQYIAEQLKAQSYKTLRMVIGMVNDKDTACAAAASTGDWLLLYPSKRTACPSG